MAVPAQKKKKKVPKVLGVMTAMAQVSRTTVAAPILLVRAAARH